MTLKEGRHYEDPWLVLDVKRCATLTCINAAKSGASLIPSPTAILGSILGIIGGVIALSSNNRHVK